MRLLKILLILAGIVLWTPETARGKTPELERSLKTLDEAIQNSPAYTRIKMNTIDSLRRQLVPHLDAGRRIGVLITISDRYRPVNTDSALWYASRAASLSESAEGMDSERKRDLLIRSRIVLMNALSTAGIFTAAQQTFESLRAESLTAVQKLEFWKGARILFSYMKAYVAQESSFFDEYERQYMAYDDSLLSALPARDPFLRFIRAERLVRDNNYPEAKALLTALMRGLPEESNLYGMAAFQLAEVYKREGNTDGYAEMLAKASLSDIRGCIREGLALPNLAQWLYTQGNLHDAFRYINFALSQANEGNARMRSAAIASLMPVIDSAYREKISDTNRALTIVSVFVTLFFVMSLILVVLLVRYIRRARHAHERLKATSRIQDSYIGHFISLCASYAGKLDSLTSVVSRKISSGQSEELLKLIKSGRFADTGNDDFYTIFDSAFLEIYPHFIEEINCLLQPEKRFAEEGKQVLVPELRIYALVRLGITESTRISQVLHYTVSTIYTYRNRMRNRAVNRETFEQDVLKIGEREHESMWIKHV